MSNRRSSRASSGRQRDIPETMSAAALDRFGPPSVLTLHHLPVPTPRPHEVLIAIDTAQAHRRLERERVLGRMVLTIQRDRK
jgi:hypothetical protein